MRCENQAGLSVGTQLVEKIEGVLVIDAVFGARSVGIEYVQPVDMSKLGGDAAEIVPGSGSDLFDFRWRFFRERGDEILTRDAILFQQRPDPPRHRRGEPCHRAAVDASDPAEQGDEDSAQDCVASALRGAAERARKPSCAAAQCRRYAAVRHQSVITIFPNTWRLSRRVRARSNSASGAVISITGASPDAILVRLSRMLRIEAPKEPMM